MRTKRIIICCLLSSVAFMGTMAQHTVQSLNDGWQFSEDKQHWQPIYNKVYYFAICLLTGMQ